MGCNNNNGCGFDCGCERQERREYNCPNDRRVIKHRHIVKHRHDNVHEYEVIHRHDHHHHDVVVVREEHKHHDHRKHKPEYCGNGCYGNNGEIGIQIVSEDNDCGCE